MKRIFPVYFALVLTALSCGVFPAATGTPAAAPQYTLAVTPLAAAAGQKPVAPDLSGYFLPDPSKGLGSLVSYSQKLTVSFKGTRGGKQVEYTDTYNREVNTKTNAFSSMMEITGPDGSRQRIVSGSVGDIYYSISGDAQCRISRGERADGYQPFLPERLLPPVKAADESGREEVNSVPATRYTFKAAADASTAAVAEGQVWLAKEGGYILRMSRRFQDSGAVFGEGVTGEQVIAYELTRVNTLGDIPLPASCNSSPVDFPAMPDAYDFSLLPGVLAYSTASKVDEVSGFYVQKLKEKGWNQPVIHPYPKDGSTLVFTYPNDARRAMITLQASGKVTWVTIKLDERQD